MKRMFHHIAALLAVLLASVPAWAGDLKVSETLIDYGSIKEGPAVVKTITITNTGAGPLDITNVTAS